jgi:hypothetical protein
MCRGVDGVETIALRTFRQTAVGEQDYQALRNANEPSLLYHAMHKP